MGRIFLAGLAALACGACTSTPTPAEMLTVGHRSPEQCFATFQLAVRADEPRLEYNCFSQQFREENHLSQWAWREVREQLWGQIGMRWAVAKAKPSGPAQIRGNRATLEVSALGKHLRLEFVREEAGQLWSGETLITDELLDFRSHSGAQDGGLFYGQVPLPPERDPGTVTELHLGQEWKLDKLVPLDGS